MRATLRTALAKSSRAAAIVAAGLLVAGAPPVAAGEAGVIVVNPDSAYPEGPLVAGGDLYYAEMGSDRVMRFDGAANAVVWSRPGCGPTSVAQGGEGTLIVLCHRQELIARISASGETLTIIDRDAGGRRLVTPNASVGDGRGGVYFSSSGDFAPGAPAEGAVLYLAADGTLRRVAEGIHYSNGVALTPDGERLYVSEHLSRRVLVFDVAADGSLSGRRVFVGLDDIEAVEPGRPWEAGPDGLAVDRAGHLYIAEYGAGRLLIVDATGKLAATIPVPERFVTAMALSADERTLFITAPGTRGPPYKGAVYAVPNPVFGQ